MRLLRSALRRPLADILLVVNAVAVHLTAAAALRVVGLKRISAWLTCGSAALPPSNIELERRVAWAVRTATHLVPAGRTCLSEALTAVHLLGRRGSAATLRIGVAKSGDRELAAHAWVEQSGRTIIGGETAAEYLPLVSPKEVE
jgi:hypothetical protein